MFIQIYIFKNMYLYVYIYISPPMFVANTNCTLIYACKETTGIYIYIYPAVFCTSHLKLNVHCNLMSKVLWLSMWRIDFDFDVVDLDHI